VQHGSDDVQLKNSNAETGNLSVHKLETNMFTAPVDPLVAELEIIEHAHLPQQSTSSTHQHYAQTSSLPPRVAAVRSV
jgi:hypothetical protein